MLDDITTGASQDIKQATGLARSMVMKFGMSETVGLINYDDDSDEVFIGRDLAHASRGYGENVATTIDQEVKRIIDECYEKAKTIIQKYDGVLHECAELCWKKKKFPEKNLKPCFRKNPADLAAEDWMQGE